MSLSISQQYTRSRTKSCCTRLNCEILILMCIGWKFEKVNFLSVWNLCDFHTYLLKLTECAPGILTSFCEYFDMRVPTIEMFTFHSHSHCQTQKRGNCEEKVGTWDKFQKQIQSPVIPLNETADLSILQPGLVKFKKQIWKANFKNQQKQIESPVIPLDETADLTMLKPSLIKFQKRIWKTNFKIQFQKPI